MPVSPARAAGFEILLRVEREGSYAADLLHSDAFARLETRDHGLATELVMGVLRWRSLLDQRLAVVLSQKIERLDVEVLTALRLGAYQLLFLSRVPARAAIFESVELVKAARKRSAAPFVNAVLRKVGSPAPADFIAGIRASPDVASLALNAAHPASLVERWAAQFGLQAARQICIQNQSVPSTAIYLHENVNEAELASAGVQLAPGRLLASARQVVAGNITATQAYREGRISIQDEASQLVAQLAARGDNVGSAILDCCAAPGNKTRVIASRNPGAKVFATEVHPHRARLLHSLNRLPNMLIIAADARSLPFSHSFDRILADVPCSGTGTLNHNPEIKWRIKLDDLQDLHSRQVAILRSALAQLSVGGRVVYSTCSLEREENEAVIEAALEQKSEFQIVDLNVELEQLMKSGELSSELTTSGVTSLLSGPYLRTIPGVHPCEGFFAAMIQRR
jgi:16S rRNA (cytosine967-C5)-methyltransferase